MRRVDISVIVPVYNAERFVDRCIESILSQNFNAFELILVDDGSIDRSGNICDEYAKKDSRIRVLHQSNAGVSVARNLGIKNAQGKYISFVDADDVLLPDALSNLWMPVLHYSNVNVVCGQIRLRESILGPDPKVPEYTEDKDYIRSLPLWELLNFSACARLVSKDLIETHGIYFSEGITCGEDPLWIFMLHKYVRSVAQCRITVYQYIENPNSVMHQNESTMRYISTLKCAALACRNFGPDGKKAECAYILDLLNVGRCIKSLDSSNNEIINDQIDLLYTSLLNKEESIRLPLIIKFALWRLKQVSLNRDHDIYNIIFSVLRRISLL